MEKCYNISKHNIKVVETPMGSIYQLTFFLAVALLAIVATLFVLAVSLLGRAVRLSTEEQKKAEETRKGENEDEIKKMQIKLDQAKDEGQLNIADLEKSLKEMRKQAKKYECAIKRIEKKPRFLKARWGVLFPGVSFIASIIFSGLALNLLSSAFIASLCLWVIALVAIAFGIYLICQSLMVIEGVAITSEETAFVREAEALKTSLRKFEDERKPELEFSFSDAQPPFRMAAESEIVIKFHLSVTGGDVAKDATVFVTAPLSFEFPDTPAGLPPKGYEGLTNYISTQIELGNILKGLYREGTVKLKAPSEPKKYNLFYSYLCEGYGSGMKEFQVVVE